MKTYPIAIELTAWVELGLNQYEVTLDEISKITVKRTDDVLHSKALTDYQVQQLIEAIELIAAPVMLNPADKTLNKADSSYELIIESAHFSMEFNWEDVEVSHSQAFQTLVKLADLIQSLGQFH